MGSGVSAVNRLRIPGLRTGVAGRLQTSGLLIASGLLLELVTLFWNHPISLFLFLIPGSLLVGAGILLYLWSIVTRAGKSDANDERDRPVAP